MTSTHRVTAIVSRLWLVFSPALAGAGGKPAAVDAARLTAADRDPGNWMSHGGAYGEQRFSSLVRVNDKNIDRLSLAWQFKYDLDRVVEATPAVVDGVLYTTGAHSRVYVGAYDGRLVALDARTGRKAWSADTVIDHGRNYTITGAPRIAKGKVIIGNGGAEFGVRGYDPMSFNPQTGLVYIPPHTPAEP